MRPTRVGGLLSAALSVGSRPPGITWRLVLWSPDFPPLVNRSDKKAKTDTSSDNLANSTEDVITCSVRIRGL